MHEGIFILNRISLLSECKREGKLPSPLLWVSRYSFVFNFSILICYSHFCALVFKFKPFNIVQSTRKNVDGEEKEFPREF